jgi:ParB-like chromosome segregation protein Spo0J
MINTIVDIKDIQFIEEDPGKLLESIEKRGVAIPVQVNVRDGYYECLDGNKRLTACKILIEKNEKFRKIPVVLMNDYSKAGSGFWGNTRNHH